MTGIPIWPIDSEPNRRRRRLVVWFRNALAIGLLAFTVAGAFAYPLGARTSPELEITVVQSLQDLQQQQQQLQEQQNDLRRQQDQIRQQQDTSEDRLEGLEQTILATANQISETEYRLGEAQKRLQQLQQEFEQAQASYDAMQKATVARLQFLQRQQGSEGWAVLLQSANFNEFLDRRYQLEQVFAADQKVLQTVKAEAEKLNQQQLIVEQQKNQVALIRQQLLLQKQQYEQEAEAESQLIARLKDQRSALEAAEAQLERDSERIGALILDRLAASTGVIRGTGRFIYPANARLTSRFGSRIHPILGYRRFHAGVDFGASTGTTIRAADSGRVIFSGWYGGYGQAVIIDHGGGLTTLYAHASRLFVREGQGVTQGQPIAAVGSTGLSTGPHLHFEVRQNGSPVNPMAYL